VTANILKIGCVRAILSAHILTSLGEVQCKNCAPNIVESFELVEYLLREGHIFLMGINKIAFMDLL
jgi:hypothetical protein